MMAKEFELDVGDNFGVDEYESESGRVNGGVSGRVSGRVKEAVTIGVGDAINDAVKDAVTETVKLRLRDEILLLISNNGFTTNDLVKELFIPLRTVGRDIKLLKEHGFITFEGAPKSGRYIATERTKQIKIKKL